ncbi:MAG: hypothetical protein H6738_11810 [Alphaproteobacteria bacterium]|nr:hypothetical protein [Alphaproteobacteria bacterium]
MLLIPAVASAQALTVPPLVVGQPAALAVTGASPGAQVGWYASLAGPGAGPCAGAVCLGLASPIQVLGTTLADGSGSASLDLVVPDNAPIGPVSLQAGAMSGPVGARRIELTQVVDTEVLPLSSLSEDFESGVLGPAWTVLHPQLATISFVNGSLRIVPTAAGLPSIWYQDGEGPLVSQRIRGDFTVTTRALAHDPSGAAPPVSYRLGGITVRNPDDTVPGTHDFVHVAVGSGDPTHPFAVEHKITVDSQSTYAFDSVPFGPVDLRIVRTGDVFELSFKLPADASWTPSATYVVPQMPATVEVGLMAYANASPIDLQVDFDAFDLSP